MYPIDLGNVSQGTNVPLQQLTKQLCHGARGVEKQYRASWLPNTSLGLIQKYFGMAPGTSLCDVLDATAGLQITCEQETHSSDLVE